MLLRPLALLALVATVAGCGSGASKACSGLALASVAQVELPAGSASAATAARLCVDSGCRDTLVAVMPDGPFVSATAPELDGASRTVHLRLELPVSAAEGDVTTRLLSPGCQTAMIAAARLDQATGTLQPSTFPR